MNGIGLLIRRSMAVRITLLGASGQVPIRTSPMKTVVDVPSLMSEMLTLEFMYVTPLS